MKKSILFTSAILTTISIMAFSIINWNGTNNESKVQTLATIGDTVFYTVDQYYSKNKPDFYYGVDSRFFKTLTKAELNKAKKIADLFTAEEIEGLDNFTDVKIKLLRKDNETFELAAGEEFSAAQLRLLQTADYSTDFVIESMCRKRLAGSDKTSHYDFVYYITVVPEHEAEYNGGTSALINHLKEKSNKETSMVEKGNLKSGKVRFTVSRNGTIENVYLESTSGYNSIDEKMLQLITELPGTWKAATNLKGEKVSQQLVFSFGNMGC